MKVHVAFAVLIFTALVSTQTKAWEFENWPMYGKDPSHSFSNPLTQINTRNVASLTPAWTFPTGDAVTASPAVVDGVVYVGSWDGFFYAIDAGTGQLKWKAQVDCQPSVVPLPQICGGPPAGTSAPSRFQTPGGIITSSAAVVDNRVYFGAEPCTAFRRATGGLFGSTSYVAIPRMGTAQRTRTTRCKFSPPLSCLPARFTLVFPQAA
jgi:glucose dehydrogenase